MPAPNETSFALACNQIAQRITDLVLHHDTAIAYTRVSHSEQVDQGPSGYRNFWFSEPRRGEVRSTRGRMLWCFEVRCEIRVRIHLGGKTLRERPEVLWHEGTQIAFAVDGNDHWIDGTETITTESVRFEAVGDDAIVVVPIVMWLQEQP